MIKNNLYILKRYYQLIEDNKNKLIPFYIFVFLNGVIDLLIPVFVSKIINLVTLKSYQYALFSSLLLGVLYFLNTFLSYLDCKIYSKFLMKNYTTIHKKIVDEVYKYDEEYEKTLPKGKILNSISMDLINISEMADYFYSSFIQIIKFMIICICFIKINVFIAIFILFLDMIYIKISYYLNNKSAHYFKLQRKQADNLTSLLQQTLLGLKDIKTMGLSTRLEKKFKIVRLKWENNYITKRKYIILQKTILKYIIYIGKIFLYFISIYYIYLGKIEIGFLVLLISYYDKLFEASTEIMNNESQIKEENVSMERIYQLLEYNQSKESTTDVLSNQQTIGEISLKNVCFSYCKDYTLNNISFNIVPDCLNVIIGKNGSGKTTIFNLIMKLYQPSSGNIYLDYKDIYRYPNEEYMKNISILNQDTFLFNFTIKENLNLVCDDENKQIEVCKKVGIHDFILSLPKGYNTKLSENSTNLSGGQKRLLSLARTLLDDKKILLFDEATASLDSKTTKIIIDLLQDLRQNHTVVVITHKQEIMKKADKIIVIDKGKKVGEGTHNDLIKKNKNSYSLGIFICYITTTCSCNIFILVFGFCICIKPIFWFIYCNGVGI